MDTALNTEVYKLQCLMMIYITSKIFEHKYSWNVLKYKNQKRM